MEFDFFSLARLVDPLEAKSPGGLRGFASYAAHAAFLSGSVVLSHDFFWVFIG